MKAILDEIIDNAMKTQVKSALVIFETTISKADLLYLIKRDIKTFMIPKNINVCNLYKKELRGTRLFDIVFMNDLNFMNGIDVIIASDEFDVQKLPLNLISNVKFAVTKTDIDGFSRMNDRILVRDDNVIISSTKNVLKEASIINILNIKPSRTDYGNGLKTINGKLAVGVSSNSANLLDGIMYLDVEKFVFSDSSCKDGFVKIDEINGCKIKAILEIMSNSEFKTVIEGDIRK